MPTRTFVGSILFALLPLAAFVLPSCGGPACDNGGEGCPCERAIECGELPPCKGWRCDGTCHMRDAPVAWTCPIGVCDGAGHCLECLQHADCAPGHTCEAENVCSRCDDGVQNGDETGVDCGGSCPLCPGTCNVDADCGVGGYCWQGLCARCDDGIKNGNEHDVDCSLFNDGGRCSLCYGGYCMQDADCASGACELGACCKEPCPLCYECSLKTGECSPIGLGAHDVVVGGAPGLLCVDNYICNGKGQCRLSYGNPCTQNEECASEQCLNGVCD